MKRKLLFRAGQRYALTSRTALVERTTSKPNVEGGMDEILLNGQELLLGITGEDGNEYRFIDGRHLSDGVTVTAGNSLALTTDFTLQHLLEHFEIPDVPDVAMTQPQRYAEFQAALLEIQQFIHEQVDARFGFKKFQRDDLSRAALHNGAILAWSTGLGKSIAAIVFSLLKVGANWERSRATHGLVPFKPVLLVAPENLHDQLAAEWKRRFGVKVIRLDCQDTYLALPRPLAPGWYLTSYTQLGMNKISRMPIPLACPVEFNEVAKLMHFYGVSLDDAKNYKAKETDLFAGSNPLLERAIAVCNFRYTHFAKNVGEVKNGIKCIFGPSLADLCGHEFACVVIDEGIRIKGEDTIIGRAVRELDPPFRLVLTATPIKNRLRDIFWLLHWAAGGNSKATARFPYTDEDDQQDKFTAEFNVCERNLSAEARAAKERGETAVRKRRKKARGRPGVQVCNIHRLWKLIAPNILRRRKQDIGEDIVAKRKQIIRVPMGEEQYQVYKYHLTAPYVDKNGQPAYMAKLQALRSAAAAPNSELLKEVTTSSSEDLPFRSKSDYTPKLAACLTTIEQRLREYEQSVVFSALHEPLDTLSRRLTEANIPHDVLDSRVSAKRRGELAAAFKEGLPRAKPVLLCGLKSMGEGNNWPRANNVIPVSYDWAYDANEQGPDRCHRLDSEKDLNVWPIIAEGSIERKLEAGYDEKGDAAELVLDGQLLGENVAEVNLLELLKIAEEDFRHATTYPESKLEAEWPELKARLAEAWQFCKRTNRKPVKPAGPVPLARLLATIKTMQAA